MNSLRYPFGLSGLAGVSALAAALIFATACGGDDTAVTPDGSAGQGGGAGGGATGTAGKAGAGSDSGGTGGSGGLDGGTAGSGPAGSGPAGAGPGDAGGRDSGKDADAATDSAGTDGPDGGPTLTIQQYQHAIATAWCDRIAECCTLDAVHFDRDTCIAQQDNSGGPERVSQYLVFYKGFDAGFPSNLQFDPVQAAQCVSLQRNRGCVSEDGDEKANIYATCMTAVQGSGQQNMSCNTSLECGSGLYCGGGVCTPLAEADGTCDDPNLNSDRCTFLGLPNAGALYCAPAGDTGRHCAAAQGTIGTACTSDRQCQSRVCSSVSRRCVNSQPYPSTITCTLYTKSTSDAGDGG